MSGIDKYYKDCISQAIITLLDNGNRDSAMVRYFIRQEIEEQLDEICGKVQGNDGRFNRYLKQQAESCLWNSEGDEEHDGNYYQTGAASCFFPVAARKLVEDGLDPSDIALFCVQAATEVLKCNGHSLEYAENKLMQIVLGNRMAEEFQEWENEILQKKQKISSSRN